MLGMIVSLSGARLFTWTWGLLVCVVMFLGAAAFCCHASFRCRNVLWPYFFVFTLLCRVGEATNPGPANSQFILGAFNPSGLKGKGPYIVSQLAEGDLWAISETHLCSQSLQAFGPAYILPIASLNIVSLDIPSQLKRIVSSMRLGGELQFCQSSQLVLSLTKCLLEFLNPLEL
jgi:hypothetical protein